MIILIDFDATLAVHKYPAIGDEVPYAIQVCKALKDKGHRLILYTMRSDKLLEEAICWCREKGLEFDYANENPEQLYWTTSPKVHRDLVIDDRSFGCPIILDPYSPYRRCVDWTKIANFFNIILLKNTNINKL